MAGRTLTVDMADDDVIPAWRTVSDLAAAGVSADWTLVGGLMVAVHARRSGIVMRRPTDDVDVLVDYMANRAGLIRARSALLNLGFGLDNDGKYAYRFRHADGRKLDLMVADHLPSRMHPRLDRRPAFAAPAAAQALRRRDTYRLGFSSGTVAEVGVPDELGALVAKAAAWLADRRDRGRHLDDSAILLACIADASELDYDAMSKNDRKRIRAVTDGLMDPAHVSWVNLDDADRDRGMFTLRLIRQVLEAR
jgi:hypothetical protein